MRKKFNIVLCLILCFLMAFSATACKKKGEDGEFEDDGSYKPSAKGSLLNFWGWGTNEEGEVFSSLTDEFNKGIGKDLKIEVKYTMIPSGDYDTRARFALSTAKPPDIVYAGDGNIKQWVENDYLQRLDDPSSPLLEMNGGFDLDAIWPSAINRYRYNPVTTTSNDDDPLWGLPKDIGPTVIYYNKTYMINAGITIVSVPREELDGEGDRSFGKTIAGTTDKTYSYKGYDADQLVFNNRIAMNWEETVALSKKLMKTSTPANTLADFGFFTEWWFNYGWSVGGDCMEKVPTGTGDDFKYEFTLGDTQKNYMVPRSNAGNFTVNGNTYKPGEIISYVDKAKLTTSQKDDLHELPSMREAFVEFCRLSASPSWTVDGNLKGYGIAMNPKEVSETDYSTYFATGRCAMYIDGRWAVTAHRKTFGNFDWDVAPLPVYRTYNSDGTVDVEGLSSGHSGSMAIAISKNSSQKSAAWVFLQFISGERGQSVQAKQGFAIPNQMELAYDDEVFLQPTKKPANSIVFVEAALNQRPADWTYLKNGEWINIWAPTLNSKVRDGEMTVTEFFNQVTAPTNTKLLTYTA